MPLHKKKLTHRAKIKTTTNHPTLLYTFFSHGLFSLLSLTHTKSPLSVEPSKSSALFAESEGPTQRGTAAWHQPHFPPADAGDETITQEQSRWSSSINQQRCDVIDDDDDFSGQPSTAITILVSPDHFNVNNIDETSTFAADCPDEDDDENPFQLEELPITSNRRHRRMASISGSVRRGPSSSSKVCLVCNKTFSRAWSLQRHMTDRHFYVPQHLACDICGRTYRSRNSLISHKSQYHGAGISSKIMGEGGSGGSGGSGALRMGRSKNDVE